MLAANGLYCPRFVLDLKPAAAARQTGGGGRHAARQNGDGFAYSLSI